jgi:hypothetical protein
MTLHQQQFIVIIGLVTELAAGIFLLNALMGVRMMRADTRAQLAAAIAKRRSVDDPEIPEHVAECLRGLATDTAVLSAGRRMTGQVLADKLRTTLRIPDSVLAVTLHEVLCAAAKLASVDATDGQRFSILVDAMSVAAVDLSSLERELTP